MNFHSAHVAHALAHYLGITQGLGFRELRLKRDLGLEPLDLVLFVLELEDPEQQPFDYAELDGLDTVGQMVDLVGHWLGSAERASDSNAAFVDWVADHRDVATHP